MKRLTLLLSMFILASAVCGAAGEKYDVSAKNDSLLPALKQMKPRIVFESNREGSFDIFVMNADGSSLKNLTNTPDVDETYPQCSPNGKLIAFEACDNTTGAPYRIEVMNADGSGRRKLIDNARQMAWSPDGSRLAFSVPTALKPHYSRNKELSFYDVGTGKVTRWSDNKTTFTYIGLDGKETKFPVSAMINVLNPTWSKDGKWILASLGGSLNVSQTIIAIEVGGDRVVDFLHMSRETTGTILGCRPCINPDGTLVTWAIVEPRKFTWIGVSPIYMDGLPKVAIDPNFYPVGDKAPMEFYHPDWSPDGRYIAFSRGPRGNFMKMAVYAPGAVAKDWDICIVDTRNPGAYTMITRDGKSNKEPDWLLPTE